MGFASTVVLSVVIASIAGYKLGDSLTKHLRELSKDRLEELRDYIFDENPQAGIELMSRGVNPARLVHEEGGTPLHACATSGP